MARNGGISRKECDTLRDVSERRMTAMDIQVTRIDERLNTICRKVDNIENSVRTQTYALGAVIIVEIVLRLTGFNM